MGKMQLPPDFKEFLQLLNSHKVEYLIVGGYAIGYHGFPRTTGDIDIWVAISDRNAATRADARIEILTKISGVQFEDCYPKRIVVDLGGVVTSVIGIEDLKINKRAAGRLKDLNDLENLG